MQFTIPVVTPFLMHSSPQELRKIPLNRFGSEESSPGRFLISDSPQAQAWTPESQACLLLIIIQVKKDNITTVLP
jgi:hypothetical protein